MYVSQCFLVGCRSFVHEYIYKNIFFPFAVFSAAMQSSFDPLQKVNFFFLIWFSWQLVIISFCSAHQCLGRVISRGRRNSSKYLHSFRLCRVMCHSHSSEFYLNFFCVPFFAIFCELRFVSLFQRNVQINNKVATINNLSLHIFIWNMKEYDDDENQKRDIISLNFCI